MAMNHDAVVHEVGDVPDCPVGLPNQRGFYHYNRSLLYQEFGEYSVCIYGQLVAYTQRQKWAIDAPSLTDVTRSEASKPRSRDRLWWLREAGISNRGAGRLDLGKGPLGFHSASQHQM
ncbi:hypothetical protein E4U30_001661 [Claviceps sp. LM220 group G6]|nr:hypothetical protein E4U30_001661 [Claviceps sp. LM220 group G6]